MRHPYKWRQRLKHRLLVWWHGGEDSRQARRRDAGVYREDDGFSKPETPSPTPSRRLVGLAGKIIFGVIVGLLVLVLWNFLLDGVGIDDEAEKSVEEGLSSSD